MASETDLLLPPNPQVAPRDRYVYSHIYCIGLVAIANTAWKGNHFTVILQIEYRDLWPDKTFWNTGRLIYPTEIPVMIAIEW